jgi:hypothetical protein
LLRCNDDASGARPDKMLCVHGFNALVAALAGNEKRPAEAGRGAASQRSNSQIAFLDVHCGPGSDHIEVFMQPFVSAFAAAIAQADQAFPIRIEFACGA